MWVFIQNVYSLLALLTGAVEYTDCTSAEE